ncbi:MAG: LytR/AlgR family response regulator transcription factor [Bacillota bacterium]
MKLKTLIVDDEYPARQELRFMLSSYDNVEIVGEATSGLEALKLLDALDYSILFLDIEMPGMNGLELGNIIQNRPNPPYIIFVTAYEEYAVRAFEVNAIDYLLKPFDERRLTQSMSKVFRLIEQNQTQEKEKRKKTGSGETSKIDRIPVEKQGKTLLISEDEIIFAYTQDDNVYIKNYQDRLVTRFTLKELESRLSEKNFFRTHRCYIVNLNKVQEIIPFFNGTYTLIVDDAKKSEVPVSRNQAKKLKRLLGM